MACARSVAIPPTAPQPSCTHRSYVWGSHQLHKRLGLFLRQVNMFTIDQSFAGALAHQRPVELGLSLLHKALLGFDAVPVQLPAARRPLCQCVHLRPADCLSCWTGQKHVFVCLPGSISNLCANLDLNCLLDLTVHDLVLADCDCLLQLRSSDRNATASIPNPLPCCV